LSHILQILPGESLGEFFGQIPGKPIKQLSAIVGALSSALFKLDDS